jgi:zinc transporter ZupT
MEIWTKKNVWIMQHNFTDGMALGSAFLLHGSVGGWSRTLFLLAHELPQEVTILYLLNFQSLLNTFLMYSSFTLCHSLIKFMLISVSGTWKDEIRWRYSVII